MPTYRSISLSIVSQQQAKPHPEFPHPESDTFGFNSPYDNVTQDLIDEHFNPYRTPDKASGLPIISPSTFTSNGKTDKILGRQPSFSVYIPSLAGARFWLRYAIEPNHPPTRYFYFKLFMNGRHIVSWGVNPETTTEGQVMRAPFEVENRYAFNEDGDIYKQDGLEVRPFFFAGVDNKTSSNAATEGGCIEVQVFRSRGKKRRIPDVEQCRKQDKHGLLLPEGSVAFSPQDMRFYEWILTDPKDSPYARFRFYYRSWDQLQNLQLIPENHPRRIGSPTPSETSMNETGAITRNSLDSIREGEISLLTEHKAPWSAAVAAIRDQNELDDESYTADYSDTGGDGEDEEDSELRLPALKPQKYLPGHRTQRSLTSSISNLSAHAPRSAAKPKKLKRIRRPLPDPTKIFSTELPGSKPARYNRPLPDPAKLSQNQLPGSQLNQWDRPLPEPPGKDLVRKRGSSGASTRSVASDTTSISIRPSLRAYFDKSDDDSEHEICVAQAVKVVQNSPSSDYSPTMGHDQPSFASFASASEVYHFPNPPNNGVARARTLPPPEAYFSPSIASTFPYNMPPSFGTLPSSYPTMPDMEDPFGPEEHEESIQQVIGSSPSVREWLRRTPSPTRMNSLSKELPESPHFAESTVASRAKVRSKTPDFVRIREDSSPEDIRSRAKSISSFWRRRNDNTDAAKRSGTGWF